MVRIAICGTGVLLLTAGVVAQSDLFDTLGGGVGSPGVYCIVEDTVLDKLVIAGSFSRVDGEAMTVLGITTWNGSTYSPVGCGLLSGPWDCVAPVGPNGSGNPVRAVSFWNGQMFAGGSFDHAGSLAVGHIAAWDGSTWQQLLAGVDGPVFGMKAYPDGLYVAGWFHNADTVEAHGLARWDGAQWHDVHDLPDMGSGGINDVAIYNGVIYVGGNFAGGSGRNNIAKWNGTEWVSIDGQGFLGTTATVNKMKVNNGLLYVAGSFADFPPLGVATNPGSGILAWDGSNWIDLAGGTDGAYNASVLDMVWIRDTMYAVGRFDKIGGVPTGRVARWDGSRWCSLVPWGYFYPDIVAIGTYRDSLFVGGSFTVAGPDSINRVAKWIGGSYTDTCGFAVGIAEQQAATFSLHPNPASTLLTITTPALWTNATLLITDPLGRVVLRQVLRENTINVQHLAPGPYMATLLSAQGERSVAVRWVKE